jgi:hypothetical protein
MDEFPSISDLFDFISDDIFWGELEKTYFYVFELGGKFIVELFKKSDIENTNDKKDIDDYRYFARRYLFRSFRIYRSIVLLSIYNSWFEAQMVSRPLLENIAETKYFIKARRAKAIRLIKLYEFVNDKTHFDSLYSEDSENIDKNGYIILSKYSIDYMEKLRESIVIGLSRYRDDELFKMERKIKNNLSWHGLSRKALFKDVNMQDDIRDYE